MPEPQIIVPDATCPNMIDASRLTVFLDWPTVAGAESPLGELARRAFPLSRVQDELPCPFTGRLVVEPMLPTTSGFYSALCPFCGGPVVVREDSTIAVGGTVQVGDDDGWGGPRS